MGTHKGRRVGLGATVLVWSWLGHQVGAARAQTSEAPPEGLAGAPSMELRELSLENLLSISVSGASKYEQRADETAASISVVTAEEIRRHGYRMISDLVRAQRGMYISDDRYSHYLGVRGFSIPGDYNSRILLLIDGHRTNDALYDSAYSTMGVEAIDRVEFIRGPSSSVYGSNAFFGVINVITKDGARSPGVLATGETSATTQHVSNYSNRGSLSVGHHWDNGLDVFVSGSVIVAPGEKDIYFSEYDAPATNNGIAHRADGERGVELLAKGKYRHFTLTLHHYNRDRHDPTTPYASVFNDNRLVQADRPSFVDLAYSRTFEPQGLTVLARTYLDTHTYDGYFPVDVAAPPDPSTIVMNRSHATARVAGGEFQLLWHLATNNRALSWLNLGLGGDYQDRIRLWQKAYVDTTPPSPPMLDDRHSSQVVGVYALAEGKVANRVVLSAGLRYDRTLGFVSAVSPRAGAVWRATPSTVVKLLYGGSFRAPNAYERFFNMGPPVMMGLNPDLKPETIRTSELVLEQSLGTHLRALASGYMYDIKNLIVTTMQPDGWSLFTNAGRIKAYGAELEIEGRWNPIRARGSYSFKRTSASDMAGAGTGDTTMPNSPTHMAKLNLLGKSPWPWLNEAIEFQYLSRRQTPRSIMGTAPSVGAYVVTNLSLSIAPLSALEATLTVRNLFNTKNSDPASLIHLQNAIPETGRTVWLRLAWKAL